MEMTRLKCPACGAAVRRTDSAGIFHCEFCGSDFAVPGADLLQPAQPRADFTRAAAGEMAIQRLKGEIKELEAQLATANTTQDRFRGFIGGGAVVMVMAIFVLAASLDMRETPTILVGLILLVGSVIFGYLSVLALKGWQVKSRKLADQVKEKSAEIEKHRKISGL